MSNVSKNDYEKIAKLYNELGDRAAMEYIQQSYGTKHPRDVIRRMKKSPGFRYDDKDNKFILDKPIEELVFMGLDELCQQPTSKAHSPAVIPHISVVKDITPESLYRDLMQEKLMELAKYVKLNRYSNTLYIDKSALLSDGYQITIG